MTESPFYMVWNPSTGQTRFKHTSFRSAENEARRLANLHKGQEFFVLGTMGRAVAENIRFDILHPKSDYVEIKIKYDEIPF